jgi:diguanylate cyclase (GGDEF)-like protein
MPGMPFPFPCCRWLTSILLALLTLVAAVPPALAGAPANRSAATEKRDLTPCFKPVAPGDDAAMLARQPAAFTCATNQRALGSGDFWVRLAVPDTMSAVYPMLRWNSLWQAGATVDAHYADGTVDRFAVPSAGSGRFVHIGATYTLALRDDAVPRTILFRIEGSGNMRGILIGPQLASAAHIASVDARRAAIYGGFAGLCLALLAYNLMMWRALREPYLLAYCATIAAGLLYAFTSSATLAQLVPDIDNNLRLRFNYAVLSVAAMCAIWFARGFLGPHLFSRAYTRFLIASGVIALAATAAFVLLAPWQVRLLDRVYFIAFSVLFIVGSGLFIQGWRKGGRLARMFALVWALPVVVNFGRLLHGFNLIPHSFWLDNATLLAMSVEALLASMLIGHRVRLMQDDRDTARAGEAAARQLADTDELTGLSNRRVLMRAVCPPPEKTGLYRLVLVDVDHFKSINDAVGHSAGDMVLQRIAAMIETERRPDAIAARLGGEEFAIIYPTTVSDRRYHTGLLDRIRALPLVRGQRVSVSMGAATGWLSGSENDWLALYRAADIALYEAKQAGRDQLVIAPLYVERTAAA